jgi:tRNA U34 5-carboxymethylaminomethyl modifying enzyme MnmG/GidA
MLKKYLIFLCIFFISCNSSNNEADIQDKIDDAVSEAIESNSSSSTTTSTTTTTTTTIYDSTCIDYANGLINIWDKLQVELINIGNVYTDLGNSAITFSAGANELFEINVRWSKYVEEVQDMTPDQKNRKFHTKLLQTFDYVSESNTISIQALDETDPDLLQRGTSLLVIAGETLEEAIEILPGGTIFALRDSCD